MKILENLRIGGRLGIGFVILLALMIGVATMGIVRLQAVGELANEMASQTMAVERVAGDWLVEISVNSERTVAVAKSDDPEVQAFFQQQIDSTNLRIGELQAKLEPLIDTAEGRTLLAEIAAARESYVTLGEGVFNKKRGGRHSAAMKMTDEEFLPAVKAYRDSIQRLVAYQQAVTRTLAAKADGHFQNGRILMASLTAAALLLGIVLAWLISRSIIHPLNEAVRIAERVADGDLSADIVVARRDETGQLLMALRDMNTSLYTVIASVRNGTDTITEASARIASGNADLSSRTDAQATSIEETASAIAALTDTVRQNADNAGQANQLVVATASVAAKGEQAFNEVVDTMASIKSRAGKIGDIIGVIDGIAFQSNILALNAAVEAARAGTHGRGFAVVASEVRNLAQRSAGAAREIKTLIEDSLQQIDQGSKLVGNAHKAMDEIVESVSRATRIMSEISVASQEQSAGLQQINKVMNDMDHMTQRNAALVGQAAAAASSLQDQAVSLAEAVRIFKLGGKVPQLRLVGLTATAAPKEEGATRKDNLVATADRTARNALQGSSKAQLPRKTERLKLC